MFQLSLIAWTIEALAKAALFSALTVGIIIMITEAL